MNIDMDIEEKGAINGILAAREHLRYTHLSKRERGVPGAGTCDWDEIHATLAAVGVAPGGGQRRSAEQAPSVWIDPPLEYCHAPLI